MYELTLPYEGGWKLVIELLKRYAQIVDLAARRKSMIHGLCKRIEFDMAKTETALALLAETRDRGDITIVENAASDDWAKRRDELLEEV